MRKKIIKKTLSGQPEKINGGIPPKRFIKDELEYDNISKEQIGSILEDLTNSIQKPTGRQFVLWRGCDNRGLVKETMGIGINHCGDDNCKGCNNWGEQLNKAMKDYLNGEEDLI